MNLRMLAVCAPVFLAACAARPHPLDDFEPVVATTVLSAPAAGAAGGYTDKQTTHGKYLVELLGCGACHTDGALIGQPRPDRRLAGSSVGLAHSNPLQVKHPAVVFASNLTPDVDTGIGAVSDRQLIRAVRGGVGRHGFSSLKVMPVAAYSRISDDDILAIVAYLRSLRPVVHRVPMEVPEGRKTDELFVHFGVYRNREK